MDSKQRDHLAGSNMYVYEDFETVVDAIRRRLISTEGFVTQRYPIEEIDKAMEMAQCIIEKGRKALQKTYPLAIYEGEKDSDNKSAYPKVFSEKLTADLLEKHQELSEACK